MITVNGTERELADGTTVAVLLAETDGIPKRGVAVAVDGEVVPRSTWHDVRIQDGARVEILTAVQGG